MVSTDRSETLPFSCVDFTLSKLWALSALDSGTSSACSATIVVGIRGRVDSKDSLTVSGAGGLILTYLFGLTRLYYCRNNSISSCAS